MDPVLIVSGNWVKRHRYVFNADTRGCRVLHVSDKTELGELVKFVLDDYGLKECIHQIQLSYMFSNKAMRNMAHDTPPVYVSNTRQLQGFLRLRKIDPLRLCVEITEKQHSEISRKRKFSKEESTEEEIQYDGYSFDYVDGNGGDVLKAEDEEDGRFMERGIKVEEEEDDEFNSRFEDGRFMERGSKVEEEEDDEFDSRFDMFEDSDGASSDDDNFSSYGESPNQDEDSPTLPPKKRPQNISTAALQADPGVLKLEMSSLDIKVGQRYETKAALEKRVKLLCARDGGDFNVPESNSNTVVIKCWKEGCPWRIRASTMGKSPEFYVRIYDSQHTCSTTERSDRSRQATPDILGELYWKYFGDVDPSVRPRHVGVILSKHLHVQMNYWKSHRTLRYARQLELGTPEKGFEDLPSYLYMIRRDNPGTVTRLQLDEDGRFKYVFLAFGASVRGFPFMRKVIVVDGTFLHGKYKGTLLTALAQDGNFQIFPVAFAVVDTENDDSWNWFFKQLKVFIPDDNDLAIISDRHNSIGKAIGNVYPMAARGICTYHLYKNILVRYRGKEMFSLVKKAARCFRLPDFIQTFAEIEAAHPELHGYLQRADVKMWARVHFPGERYNLMTTNIAESMNRALSKARSLPIVSLLESIRTMMSRWFSQRREEARSQPTTLSRAVEKLLGVTQPLVYHHNLTVICS